MKLAELGLKTKPETKYFAFGFVSFSTSNGNLDYKIYRVTKTNQSLIEAGSVLSKQQLTELLAIKSINEVIKAMK